MVHFEHPQKTIRTTTETLSFFVQPDGTLCVDEAHRGATPDTFKLCALDFDPINKGERAVLLELRYAYVHNEFEETFFWDVEGMFVEPPDPEGPGGSTHPDCTGKTCIVIPGNGYKGCIPELNRVIYKPRLKHLDINLLPYVGLETQILNANSTCISEHGTLHEYLAFNVTDPFLVFLLQHKNRFDEVNAADIKMVKTVDTSHAYYLVKRPIVKRVQSFFKTMYSLILYMQKPVIEFRWRERPRSSPPPRGAGMNDTPHVEGNVAAPPPAEAAQQAQQGRFITVIIQTDYVVLSPEVLSYKAHGEKLDM